jgi:hypothetical protein
VDVVALKGVHKGVGEALLSGLHAGVVIGIGRARAHQRTMAIAVYWELCR